MLMQSGIDMLQTNVKDSKSSFKRGTVRIFKENIDAKINKVKKYSKWVSLMQLPKVFPSLYKFCRFDYHAFLIKQK